MKELSNYINERLNPRHLGSTGRFPIDGTIDDIKVFLKNNGFREIEDDTERTERDSIDFYNKKTPDKYFSFIYDDNNKNNKINGIEFIDRTKGEISNENKLYYISFDRGKLDFAGFFERGSHTLCKYYFEEDEFLEEINKAFGWEW